MSNLAYELDNIFTYKDYISWDTKERYEIIDGVAYSMASPSVRHQEISWEFAGIIYEFLKNKPCKAFTAPFDVRLFPEEDNSDTTVVQPDILVVCDPSKLSDGKACKGAPDLIIEILSAGSLIMDRKVKAEKYLEAGVKEYWIVNAETLDVLANRLTDKKYVPAVYKNKLNSSALPGLTVDMDRLRANISI